MNNMLEEVLIHIENLRKERGKEQILIAIDGMCGAGKSTFGKLLQQRLGGNLFHMDDFFLQPHQKTTERMLQPGGNVDYERFRQEILDRLKDEAGFVYGIYNCKEQCIDRKVHVDRAEVNIIEGSYCLHPYFGEAADICIFLKVSKEEQLRRIRGRNGKEQFIRFQEEWIPKENLYFDTFEIPKKCICYDTTNMLIC